MECARGGVLIAENRVIAGAPEVGLHLGLEPIHGPLQYTYVNHMKDVGTYLLNIKEAYTGDTFLPGVG